MPILIDATTKTLIKLASKIYDIYRVSQTWKSGSKT